jgi:hypothetical protein
VLRPTSGRRMAVTRRRQQHDGRQGVG